MDFNKIEIFPWLRSSSDFVFVSSFLFLFLCISLFVFAFKLDLFLNGQTLVFPGMILDSNSCSLVSPSAPRFGDYQEKLLVWSQLYMIRFQD